MSESPAPLSADSRALFSKYNNVGCLDAYLEQLLLENHRQNLVSRETSRDDLVRLAAESLLPLESLNITVSRYLDIGSGGGLPAVPLMLALKPEVAVLVERSAKKGSALNRILHHLGLKAQIFRDQFDRYSSEDKFNLISIRLVTLTPDILTHALNHLADDGRILYYARANFEAPTTVCSVTSYRMDNRPDIKHFSIIKPTAK